MSDIPQTIIGKLIAKIVNLFHRSQPIVDAILDRANQFVNALKVLEASDIGQFLEVGIEAIYPPSTGIVNAIRLALPKVAAIITNTQHELDKTDEQKLADLAAYLQSLKADPVLYAGALTTLNAWAQQMESNSAGAGLTIPMSLAGAPVVHDVGLGMGEEE